ncbi:E3 ubiquitin-protein ligase PRT1 isoform X2 [Citrus clementina]|uniref:E3 ubiquitin-protein ligase PRT1 isoform X2 n=1 Tax=Citrus clementina TaxID=85681 RepID=UPI000CECE7F0|nr:E3 ubiquitin-protein ligase PRT1 isoform X2 [Citrus x clementina]
MSLNAAFASCGHISCFWCVYNAMNSWHESNCPVCRNPYNHFPSICHLLHFLLKKLYPLTYEKRERQVAEEEKQLGHFSPQVDYNLFGSPTNKEVDILGKSLDSPSQQQIKLYSESRFSGEGKSSPCMKSLETTAESGDDAMLKLVTSSECSEATANSTAQECGLVGNDLEHKAENRVSVDDLSCAACKKMLFKPVVLNCGHVFCELCLFVPEDGNFKCPNCQSLQPYGLPSVCLIIEHFLEERFSDLYAERKEALLKQTSGATQARRRKNRSASFPKHVYASLWLGNGPKIHFGVGCDYCGMSPIIGERYKCKDCVESIGFDLCEACHNNPAKVPGRFNQQHKPEHKFEIMQPTSLSDLINRINSDMSDDEGSDATENRDGVARTGDLSGDVPEDPENDTNDLEDASSCFLPVDASLDPQDDSDERSSDFP